MLKPKRIFSSLLLIIFLFSSFLPAWTAQAAFSWPSPTSAFNQVFGTNPGPRLLDQIMGNLGADKEETKNTIATANVTRQKKQAPQVSLNFFPENPTVGEMVTATAQPTYFFNAPEQLYYTWYLKRADCPRGSLGSHPATCDPSGDGDIDIEDYKIAAARIIASNDFDWDRDGNGVPDPSTYSSNTDDDGYYPPNPAHPGTNISAPFGGNDQIDKPAWCYLHNYETGNEYEIECRHVFPSGVPGTVGDGQFTLDEERFWRTDPANNDTAGTTRPDEANVVGLGIFEFKWNYQEGDLLGVAVEGVSTESTQHADSSYKTMWALPKNRCDIGADIDDGSAVGGTTAAPTTTTTTTTTASLVVPNPTCTSFTYDAFGACQPNDLEYRSVASASPQGCVGGSPILTNFCSYPGSGICTGVTYTAYGACQPDGYRYREIDTVDPLGCQPGSPILAESCTYAPPLPPLLSASATSLTFDNGSGAGIPVADWPETGFIQIGSEIIGYGGITSTGLTGLARGAEGTTATTHADGATVTGYTTTTETEVATEVSVNSLTQTATTLVTTTVTTTVRDVRGRVIGSPERTVSTSESTAANGGNTLHISNLNDCLYENLLPPSGGNEADKIKIDLSYSPEAPMGEGGLSATDLADPTREPLLAENADTLFVNSSIMNVENTDFLRYDWMVYQANDPDPATWVPIPKTNLTGSTQTGGIGVKSFSFRLKFSSALPRYLKVKLEVKEDRGGTTRAGRAFVIIPITSMANRLLAYSSVVVGDQLDLAHTPRCENLPDEPPNSRTICPVAKNEIVGMSLANPSSLENFAWTVNGQPVNYSQCFFVGCSTSEQTETMFFPVLKEPGTRYTVNLVATNIATREKINVTRVFEVVKPAVKIVSADDDTSANGAKPIVLGTYLDNTGTYTGPPLPDKSEAAFMALQGTNVRFCPVFNVPPTSFTDAAKTTWILDGQETEAEDVPGGTRSCVAPGPQGLIFGATKDIDQSYTVGINAIYRQSPAIQRMLNLYWGVQLDQFYEAQLNDTIDVSVTDSLTGLTVSDAKLEPGPKKFLASLSSNAPSYLNFLFRMVITTFLLLYFVKIIFSLLPRTDEA